MYALGSDVSHDDAEAIVWFRKAAEQIHIGAQYILGIMYNEGRGLPTQKELAKGVALYIPAAEQGIPGAQLFVGLMYAKGQGVPRDNVAGHMWLNLAASRVARLAGGRIDLTGLAVLARDAVARKMTPEQLAEAERRAREWDAAHPQK